MVDKLNHTSTRLKTPSLVGNQKCGPRAHACTTDELSDRFECQTSFYFDSFDLFFPLSPFWTGCFSFRQLKWSPDDSTWCQGRDTSYQSSIYVHSWFPISGVEDEGCFFFYGISFFLYIKFHLKETEVIRREWEKEREWGRIDRVGCIWQIFSFPLFSLFSLAIFAPSLIFSSFTLNLLNIF